MTKPAPKNNLKYNVPNDENREIRMELIKKTSLLQKTVYFESISGPKIEKLESENNELVKICNEKENRIAEIEKKINDEKELKMKLESANEYNPDKINQMIKKITKLEEKLQSLLKTKEEYLTKANSPYDEEEEEYEDTP